MRVQFDSVVFAYSGATFVYGGNTYVRDFGPNGFHMRFGAAGAAPVPQLDGSLLFSGAQYAYFDGDLTRYYAKMPTGPYTLLFAYMASAAGSYLYSCVENVAGNWFGFALGIEPVLQTTQVYNMIGNATLPRIVGTASSSVSRSRVGALTVETTPRYLVDQAVAVAPTWTVGAFGSPVYSTIAPRVGGAAVVGYFVGTISYLALLKGAIHNSDLAELSSMMMDGQKPFCVR